MDEDSQSSDTLTDSDLTIPQNYRQPYHEQLRFHEDNFISDDAVSDNGHINLNDNLSSSSTSVDGDLRQLGDGDNLNNPPPVGTDLNPGGDWHPFKSRVHCQLVMLYHGSHRRNIDMVTFRAFLEILKFYVVDEFFPTLEDIINFSVPYWEDRLLHQIMLEGNNVFAFLDPAAFVSLRLANPIHSYGFDRVPRYYNDIQWTNGVCSQSSASKFGQNEFRKLGRFVTGDLVEIQNPGPLHEQLYRVPCRKFFHIKAFYAQNESYYAKGTILIHSSCIALQQFAGQLESDDCYVAVREMSNVSKLYTSLNYDLSCRARNIVPQYSSASFQLINPGVLSQLDPQELAALNSRLHQSLQLAAVQIPLNLHCDDASMVSSKVWRSASVVGCQIAGARAGTKGSEHNNFILALTPTSKISLKRVFNAVIEKLLENEDGFESFDFFSGQVEKIQTPIACVMADLAAKADVTPFKGFRADVFCSRDLLNNRTGEGFEQKRDLTLLRNQIEEIENAPTMAEKKELGVKYGIDEHRLDCPLDSLHHFDLTRDLPADVLHHLTLGWSKKAIVNLKDNHLSAETLNVLCAILDTCVVWKEYKTRTSSSALRSIGSQIGRNIKALLQVLWYALYLFVMSDPERNHGMFSILRMVYYLSKANYIIYNENEVVWTPRAILQFSNLIDTVAAYFNREMPEILRGAKSHDLIHHLIEDIARHGHPTGFDCSPGESKMRVQKLKNYYSNKMAPSLDVAKKTMKTEVVRHIFDGGILNMDGTETATEKVIEVGSSCQSFRVLLGQEEIENAAGSTSLVDTELVNGKRKVMLRRPPEIHIAIGVPMDMLKTCKKIVTSVGSLYRDGGFYIENGDNDPLLFQLVEIYKSRGRGGHSYAVGEILTRDQAKEDLFLQEVQVKVFRRSGRLVLFEDLYRLLAVPLFHACLAENPKVCDVENSNHCVREERQTVVHTGLHYKCDLRAGTYFLVNPLALSVKLRSPFSAQS